jgi:probable phosphoglycerate mutase
MHQRWPDRLWIVRHGESAGNVARDSAHAANAARIEIASRDVDVPLSDLGRQQARSLGHWFAAMPEADRPDVILTSPYRRASETARGVIAAGGVHAGVPLIADERLREKEFGALDRLTKLGIEQHFPMEAEARKLLGKFYYRPPAGESWCDVILRLRSVLDTISLHYGGKRVLITAHQVVVLCMRYLLENLDEETILTIDAQGDVANCSVTEYAFKADRDGSGDLALVRYNYLSPMHREGTPVTAEPDPKVTAG